MPSSPTSILVHAGDQSPLSFKPLLPHLTYPYLTPSLLSSNPESNPRPGLLDDTASIRSAILSVIEKGGDVVLVVHSHAAIPRSAAVEGLDGRTRKEPGCLQQMHPYFWRSAEPDSWYVSLLASYIPANAGAIIQTQLRSLQNGVDVAQVSRYNFTVPLCISQTTGVSVVLVQRFKNHPSSMPQSEVALCLGCQG